MEKANTVLVGMYGAILRRPNIKSANDATR